MITALLVDDESLPRQLLRGKLDIHFPDIEIIGEAANGDEAYTIITEDRPDLVFLDISMPRENGFDLLKRLPHLDFELIFVTSFDQYALEAIEFCAIGYIVKPVSTDALIRAVEHAIVRIDQKHGFNHNHVLMENFNNSGVNKKIALPTSKGLEFIHTRDIIRCEGYQKYTKIHLTDGRVILSSSNIGKFINMLNQYGFYHTHKSHLVNTRFVKSYLKEGIVILEDGSNVPVARRKKNEFLEFIKKGS